MERTVEREGVFWSRKAVSLVDIPEDGPAVFSLSLQCDNADEDLKHGPDGEAMTERTSVWHSWMVEVCHTPVGTGARRSTLELQLPWFHRWAANRRRHG